MDDLAAVTLIHLETEGADWTDWQDWFAALGYGGKLRNTHRVNNYVIALQAAQDDMGAVLGWEGLTRSFRGIGPVGEPACRDCAVSPGLLRQIAPARF